MSCVVLATQLLSGMPKIVSSPNWQKKPHTCGTARTRKNTSGSSARPSPVMLPIHTLKPPCAGKGACISSGMGKVPFRSPLPHRPRETDEPEDCSLIPDLRPEQMNRTTHSI
ncbi:hypothetical protein FKM82_011617 [Ascaphus truei]